METFFEIFNWVQTQLTQNQFLVGILGGGLGYVILRFWSIFVSFISTWFVASVEVNTATGDAITAVESFFNSKDFMGHSSLHKKLSFLGISKQDDKPIFAPGYDRHYFFYKHWPFWVEKAKDEKVNNKIAYSYTISTPGISSKRILDFVNDLSKTIKENKSNALSIFSVGVEYTSNYEIEKRSMDSVFINKADKKRLIDQIDFFVNNEKWYAERGIPYKLGILLHGSPGTGKSSLIKAIATYLDSSIIYLNAESDKSSVLDTIKDGTSTDGSRYDIFNDDKERYNPLVETKKKRIPIVVIEEVDTCIQNRDVEISEEKGMKHSRMNLKDYLNIIDGVLCPPGTIFILTTNYKERLDPALVRPGRIDLSLELGDLDKDLILEMVKTYEPKLKIDIPDGTKINPSKLQEILLTNQQSKSRIESLIVSNEE